MTFIVLIFADQAWRPARLPLTMLGVAFMLGRVGFAPPRRPPAAGRDRRCMTLIVWKAISPDILRDNAVRSATSDACRMGHGLPA
jgi:hypothetical protein